MNSPLTGATLISLARPQGRTKDPVHLSVRFLSAVEFVNQYADNLQSGGLFVRNAESLTPLEIVSVDLHLPGFRCFRLKARVAYIVDEEVVAAIPGAAIGAGLELVDLPATFMPALHTYLERLGHRNDKLVLVADGECLPMLEAAGYWCKAVDAEGLVGELQAHSNDLRAIVVAAKQYSQYLNLLRGTSSEALLAIFNRANGNGLLVALDGLLPKPA